MTDAEFQERVEDMQRTYSCMDEEEKPIVKAILLLAQVIQEWRMNK